MPVPDPARPGLIGRDAGERRRPLARGQRISWTLLGARGCCGIWTGTRRIGCPLRAPVTGGSSAQCRACAAADPGQALARDAIADDGRRYVLYLAWFGPGILKVGLTAAERGQDRLLEQGAITCVMLADGSYPGIRRAERAVSAAGLARERITARAKSAAWWDLPAAAADRGREVTAARDLIISQLAWPPGVRAAGRPVTDHAAAFGLDQPLPRSWTEVTAVSAGACLDGEVTCIIGRQLLLATSAGPVLIDMRQVAGWPFTAAPPDPRSAAGLTTTTRIRPEDSRDIPGTLF